MAVSAGPEGSTTSSGSSRLTRLRGRLSLPTLRRATGLLDGRHKSVFIGHGQDFDDLSAYRPGDDVADIDWKSSARIGQPVIKRYQRETNLPLVLALDTGRTMAAQTPTGEEKRDLAVGVAEVLAYLARMRGDTIALVAGDSSGAVARPARTGSEHAETILALVDRRYDALTETGPDGETAVAAGAPASSLTTVLEQVATRFPRRSLVALITDTAHPDPVAEPQTAEWLRRLSAQHELVVVQIADDAPLGPGARRDIDMTEEIPEFLREDTALAAQLAATAEARRSAVTGLLAARRIERATVTDEAGMVDALADLLSRERLAASRRRHR